MRSDICVLAIIHLLVILCPIYGQDTTFTIIDAGSSTTNQLDTEDEINIDTDIVLDGVNGVEKVKSEEFSVDT